MAQRTCGADGCERKHWARGMCSSHYNAWHREKNGRNRQLFTITCLTCEGEHQSTRPDGKFCSDDCKGLWYSDTMRRKCKLPDHHPVMVRIIAERERRRRPKAQPLPPVERTERECPTCAAWFCPVNAWQARTMTYCSKRCYAKQKGRRRRARECGVFGNSWRWSDFMRMAARFDYRCAYCGNKPDGQLDPDHVVPLSRGGQDSLGNLLPACCACNSDKRDLLLHEWSADRERRGLPPRQTEWPTEDRRTWHLTCEISAA